VVSAPAEGHVRVGRASGPKACGSWNTAGSRLAAR
jgi:hypothetical protein